MKKGVKITLISLGSLLGLVILVVVLACWLVFTPARLTSIVNRLSENFLLCESHFEKVDLTLFKTFPDAGIEIHDVVLINPTEGAQNDTLASVGSLTVGVNVRQFLLQRQVVVHQVRLDNPVAHLYMGPDGKNNFSIFKPSTDTTKKSTQLPDVIQIEKVTINHLGGDMLNTPQRMQASMQDLNLRLKGALEAKNLDADLHLESKRLALQMADSAGADKLAADLVDLDILLGGKGDRSRFTGRVQLTLPDANIVLGGNCYTPAAMREAKGDLLTLDLPFSGSLDGLCITLTDASLQLLDYRIGLEGDVALQQQQRPLTLDVNFTTNTWQVAELLQVLPPQFTQWKKQMGVDAKMQLQGRCAGSVTDSTKPMINADLTLSKGRFSLPKVLPDEVQKIEADLSAHLDLTHKDSTTATLRSLRARMGDNKVKLTGRVDDLLGTFRIRARLQGDLALDEVRQLLPAKLPLKMQGDAGVDISIQSTLKQITHVDLAHVKAHGNISFQHLDAQYDNIYATAPQLNLGLQLPVAKAADKDGKLIGAHITGNSLKVKMPKAHLDATVTSPDIQVNLNNLLDKKQNLAAAFDLMLGGLQAQKDSLAANAQKIKLKGSVHYDKSKQNILAQLDPNVNITLADARLSLPSIREQIRMPEFRFVYSPAKCEVSNASILWGKSDYQFYGTVMNLDPWLNHQRNLHADLNFVANNADIDELLDMLSGMGTDKDTLAQQREEDNVPKEARPFIVPRNVDATLHTHIKHCSAFGNEISDLGGTVKVQDGVAILDQIGFVCRAARMQLTALYKSPRPNNLFASIDFHLLDIQVHELIHMVPCIDTLVPMLAAFDGNADFHLAGESFLNAFYKPKMSTLLGSAAISGKDLVVLDNEKTANLLKLLQVKDWRQKDNKLVIDSLDVEMTAFRKEIEVFPFQLHVGKYSVCASGKHTLDNRCNYHLELLQSPLPVRLAVDIKGTLKQPNITLGSVQYAELYRPEKRNAAQQQTLRLKQMIREALEKNVR